MTTIAYHRGPRPAPPEVPRNPVVVRTPPPIEESGKLLRVLQVAAPIAGAGTGLVFILAYRQQGSLLFIAMGAAIGIGVLVGLLTAVVQSRITARKRRRAQQRYLEYLDAVRQHLDSLNDLQRRYEAAVFPAHDELLQRARERRRLFERRPADADFLDVRAGTGALPSPAPVELQEVDPLGPDLDPTLLRAARDLVARYGTRDSGPRTIALRGAGTIVVRGDPAGARGLTRSLVTQAAVLHSPDELRIAVIGDASVVDAEWDWIKWLPHARRDERSYRVYCATEAASAGVMLRDVQACTSADGTSAHVLLVVDGWSPRSELSRSADLEAVMSAASASPVSVLCLVERDRDEPAAMKQRIVLERDGTGLIEDAGGRAEGAAMHAETLSADGAAEVARLLAPLSARPAMDEMESPATPSVAHAMGLHTLEDLDVGRTWRAAPAALLQAPMGTTPDGRTLVLDLKEFAQGGMGPHGMLVGAPGAGKSELLRTLVSALAAAHPPDLLAFVLVDFKGGAAFQPLARLPHVAGIVTNLEDDRSMVERFRLALEGEVTRRQAVFRAAGNVPDIRTYQWRQAGDPTLQPLPYLWLVVDEFAELLATFPDFDTFFEGVARLGRGLGIHVLLATQGVSSGLSRLDRYLSYRIALRTNSVAESMAVLGSNAAARLPLVPGLGYLKVGQAEPESFMAYHVSEPVPDRAGEPDGGPKVRVFKATAPASTEAMGAAPADQPAKPPRTQLDVIVERVQASGAARAHPVWVTPLPRALPLDSVLSEEDRPLVVALGLADLPLEQRQFRWGIDFAGQDGHVAIVGAPRTGRSTALRTIVSSFLLSHDPEDAQFYIVDMGGALQPLASAPHVGAVAGKNEPELARRMLRYLARAVDERDARLRRLGIGSIAELRAQRRNGHKDDGLGDLFLVIDNWGAATKAFDWIDDEVTALAGVGLSYGVHVVLSADRWGDIRPGLRDRIPGRVQLRPIEAGDSIVDARTTRALTNTPGRALVPAGFQLQLALPRVDGLGTSDDADRAFRDLVGRCARPGRPAPPMKLLPEVVPLDAFDWARWRGSSAVPIGIDDSDLQPVTLDLFSPDVQHLLVAGDSRCGKTSFVRAYMEALARVSTPEQVQFHVVDVRRGLLDAVPEQFVATHAMSAADVESLVTELQATLRTRVAPAGANRRELAERAHVSGPELVLVIDDDDIVDSYALRPLVASVAVAWDMKFHVVLARRPANAAFDGLATALVSAGAVCLEMNEANRSLVRSRPVTLPPGRAHLLERSEPPLLVQLIHPGADAAGPAETEPDALRHAG
ncbi:MAG: type VII secretion protein EccCa [Candidatus Dormibacteraeota bacterium]|nr:type VII secretion protein EccCa [Candidatus Dormibacteraeota bacterium]